MNPGKKFKVPRPRQRSLDTGLPRSSEPDSALLIPASPGKTVAKVDFPEPLLTVYPVGFIFFSCSLT